MIKGKLMITWVSILFAIILIQSANAQEKSFTNENLEETVVDYYPPMPVGFDEKKYNKGKYILENTYSAIKSSDKGFVYADYWNIAVGFSYMGVKDEYVELAFKKAVESSLESVCAIVKSFYGDKPLEKHAFYKSMPETYSEFYKKCGSLKPSKKENTDLAKYAKENSFDLELVKTVAEISEKDQRHRKGKGNYYDDPVRLKKQNKLDKENQETIEKLYAKYGKYIGKSLVGKKYESAMWAVIQHSNLAMMEKFLPVVHQAVKDGDLHVTPLKMLIDRIYAAKYKHQIFGSQGGVEIADRQTIQKVKKEFGIK